LSCLHLVVLINIYRCLLTILKISEVKEND
jgi:hypothetical protein